MSRRAIGGGTKATNSIGPADAVAMAAKADGDDDERRSATRSTRDAEPRGGVVAELQRPQRREPAHHGGHQHDEGEGERSHVVPAAAVEAAGQPHRGPLGVEDLGPGQQVGVTLPSIAATPMPTRTSRYGDTPLVHASR